MIKIFSTIHIYFQFIKLNELPTHVTELFTLITVENNIAIKNYKTLLTNVEILQVNIQ